jgi:hypothetical protein
VGTIHRPEFVLPPEQKDVCQPEDFQGRWAKNHFTRMRCAVDLVPEDEVGTAGRGTKLFDNPQKIIDVTVDIADNAEVPLEHKTPGFRLENYSGDLSQSAEFGGRQGCRKVYVQEAAVEDLIDNSSPKYGYLTAVVRFRADGWHWNEGAAMPNNDIGCCRM